MAKVFAMAFYLQPEPSARVARTGTRAYRERQRHPLDGEANCVEIPAISYTALVRRNDALVKGWPMVVGLGSRTEAENMTLRERLRQLREAAGLKQTAFATQAGINLRTLQNYEIGHRYPRP